MNISQLQTHPESSVSIQIPSEDGSPMELSNVCESQGDTDSLTSQSSKETKKKRKKNGESQNHKEKKNFIYARVSSPKQSEDLERQISDLQTSYPGFQVLSDTGSGINFKRKGFKRLLQEIMYGNVGKVVVSYRDRLCRIAFDLLEFICDQHQTELLVHNKDKDGSDEKELLEDLMAITHVFSSRLYGKRSGGKRKCHTKKRQEYCSDESIDNSTKNPDAKRLRRESSVSSSSSDKSENLEDQGLQNDYGITI